MKRATDNRVECRTTVDIAANLRAVRGRLNTTQYSVEVRIGNEIRDSRFQRGNLVGIRIDTV